MQRFLRDNAVQSLSYPDEFMDDLFSVTEAVRMNRLVGSVLNTASCDNLDVSLPTKYSRRVLTTSEIDALKTLVPKIMSMSSAACTVNSIFLKYSSLSIDGKYFRQSIKLPVPFCGSSYMG